MMSGKPQKAASSNQLRIADPKTGKIGSPVKPKNVTSPRTKSQCRAQNYAQQAKKLQTLHAELNTAKQREKAALVKAAAMEEANKRLLDEKVAPFKDSVPQITQNLKKIAINSKPPKKVHEKLPHDGELEKLVRELGLCTATHQQLRTNGFNTVDDLQLINLSDLGIVALLRDRLVLRKYLFPKYNPASNV